MAHAGDRLSPALLDVNRELPVTRKASELHPGTFGSSRGERCRRTHGDQCSKACGPGLVHELEARPAAHNHGVAHSRYLAVEQKPANQFVNGVVAANVLANEANATRRVNDSSSMDCAGGIKEILAGPKLVGRLSKNVPIDRIPDHGRKAIGQFINLLGAAEPTRRSRGCQSRNRWWG